MSHTCGTQMVYSCLLVYVLPHGPQYKYVGIILGEELMQHMYMLACL